MRVVVRKTNVHLVLTMRERALLFANGKWKTEAVRGVGDAGRKTKTQVQRAAMRQMALLPGRYQSVVTSGTRGVLKPKQLTYEIFGVTGGQRIEEYKGLRVLRSGGAAAGRYNQGRSSGDGGNVKSGVWNAPRVFKRSFEVPGGGYFAVLPSRGGRRRTAPKSLWTFGAKPNQPRQADGKFGNSNQTYGPIRRLFGPALRKEIVKDQSLATFQREAPKLLLQSIEKRITKLIKF